MTLGGSSGRDGDKISALRTKPGETGSPILLDALCYVEARLVKAFDADENTIFLGDVVAAERLNPGGRLNIGEAWSKLPPEWLEQYERNHVPQMEHARRCRELAAGEA
jgi:flavin reductase (DIM6/NTAB) family NADH-FMN oxidoreductase RutF